jgi:broad specificity phosphatase PhoE
MIKHLLPLVFMIFSRTLFLDAVENLETTTFYIVRHGQTDWNTQGRVQGQTDTPLNATGREQAQKLETELKDHHFDVASSSDLSRASETAKILLTNTGLALITDKRLRERDFGVWEGRLQSELYGLPPEKREGMETDNAMLERTFQFLNEAIQKHSGDSILVVTHGGLMKNLLMHVLEIKSGSEIQIKNAGMITLQYSHGEWSVKDTQNIVLPTRVPALAS